MPLKKAMILDVGGVLATNFTPHFWEDLASDFGLSYEALMQFRKDVNSPYGQGPSLRQNSGMK